MLRRIVSAGAAATVLVLVCGCEPQVGTKAWCDMMNGKAKGDWTANQAVDYAKHCVLPNSTK